VAGFEKPADLLHFLLDVDAYDSFVDVLGLKASQGRVLWKALGTALNCKKIIESYFALSLEVL
jgi:hypothetical protein